MPASKNFSSKQIGNFCEQVALEFYLQRGCRLIAKNEKVLGVEIDLIFETPKNYAIMVEVKSLSNPDLIHCRLTERQKQRLEMASRHLRNRLGWTLEVRLAFVLPNSKIIELRLGDIG